MKDMAGIVSRAVGFITTVTPIECHRCNFEVRREVVLVGQRGLDVAAVRERRTRNEKLPKAIGPSGYVW